MREVAQGLPGVAFTLAQIALERGLVHLEIEASSNWLPMRMTTKLRTISSSPMNTKKPTTINDNIASVVSFCDDNPRSYTWSI